ncbi:TetR/AcrR family transcriptional regulator [Portibacter marinus]|uniref:TetR/AcrR family transcriptional regulator n=1 Tax=Portibacter marinus TaxID=2898660 RepID=UPI001F382986|nr:TetR/AcrR family transcriptional regulator [Portibacter marinus]
MTILNKIIDASEKLFMTYGLKSISMDDIATKLGMSKKTIYKYCDTKERLIHMTLFHFLKREKKIVAKINAESENAVEEIIAIGRHIIKMAKKLKPALVFDLKKYHTENWELVEKHHHEFIREVITNNITRGMKEGFFRADLNPEIIAQLYVAKSLIISDEKNFISDNATLEELVREHLLYHLYGVLSEEGTKLVKNYELETT